MKFQEKVVAIDAEETRIRKTWLSPTSNAKAGQNSERPFSLRKEQSLAQLLRRPEVSYSDLEPFLDGHVVKDPSVVQQIEYNAHYYGYVERQKEMVSKSESVEKVGIPEKFDYAEVRGLSNEALQKLSHFRPTTLGQASRISGVTPVAISLMTVFLKKYQSRHGG